MTGFVVQGPIWEKRTIYGDSGISTDYFLNGYKNNVWRKEEEGRKEEKKTNKQKINK